MTGQSRTHIFEIPNWDKMHLFIGLYLFPHLNCRQEHGAAQSKAIWVVLSDKSNLFDISNLSILDIQDSSCLMLQDPTKWIKPLRKDLYPAFCRELVLQMESLDKHRLLLRKDKGSTQPLLIEGIMSRSGTVARPQERQKCSVVNGEGWSCSLCPFSITFSLPDVRPQIEILFLLCSMWT